MRIVIAYNDAQLLASGTPDDLLCEQESKLIAPLIARTLSSRGHSVELLSTTLDFWENLKALRPPPELVFNLAEGFGGTNANEPVVPAILEALGVPFTGASAHNMYLTLDKEKTKLVVQGYGIPTPPYQVLRCATDALDPALSYPLIVKPIRKEASIGIHEENVVLDAKALLKRIQKLLELYRQPVLVEHFIIGREISVGVIENPPNLHVFPPLEFLFPDSHRPEAALRTYSYKWGGKKEVMVRAQLDERTSRQLVEMSKIAFVAAECRDYARMDFRIDALGQPYLLEINYNPGIGPNTDELNNTLTMMASFEGYSFEDLVSWIVEVAAARERIL